MEKKVAPDCAREGAPSASAIVLETHGVVSTSAPGQTHSGLLGGKKSNIQTVKRHVAPSSTSQSISELSRNAVASRLTYGHPVQCYFLPRPAPSCAPNKALSPYQVTGCWRHVVARWRSHDISSWEARDIMLRAACLSQRFLGNTP